MSILDKFPAPSPEMVAQYDAAHKAREEAAERAGKARVGLELYWIRHEWELLRKDAESNGWEWAVELYPSRPHLSRVNRSQLLRRAVAHPGTLDTFWRLGWEVESEALAEVEGVLYVAWEVDPAMWPLPVEQLVRQALPVIVLSPDEWAELEKRLAALPVLKLRDPS